MKKILSVVLGMGLVLSLGMAYAEEGTGGIVYPSEKMIRDEDLPRYNLDQDRSTINQIPAEPGAEGSAAGGINREPESTGTDIEQNKAPVEKVPVAPGEEGSRCGRRKKGSGRIQILKKVYHPGEQEQAYTSCPGHGSSQLSPRRLLKKKPRCANASGAVSFGEERGPSLIRLFI